MFIQETLRVKDEELQNLARDLRARDSTINDIAEKLSETAEAAEAAAAAAHMMDKQRKIIYAEIQRIKEDSEKQRDASMLKVLPSLLYNNLIRVHERTRALYVIMASKIRANVMFMIVTSSSSSKSMKENSLI